MHISMDIAPSAVAIDRVGVPQDVTISAAFPTFFENLIVSSCTGPKKILRMVAQYVDVCNTGDWVGTENRQRAIDAPKEH